jgi:hypothetical protein
VQEPNEALIADAPDAPAGEVTLDPDALPPGQTVVFEFYFDDFDGETASMWAVSRSTTAVGECVPVESSTIVDAEAGIAGG